MSGPLCGAAFTGTVLLLQSNLSTAAIIFFITIILIAVSGLKLAAWLFPFVTGLIVGGAAIICPDPRVRGVSVTGSERAGTAVELRPLSPPLSRTVGAVVRSGPRSRLVDLRAVHLRRLQRDSVPRRPAPTPAVRSVSPQRLSELAASSQHMAVVRAGALWRLRVRSIRPGRWHVMCATAQSCWRQWLVLIPRIRLRSICQCLNGKRV